MKKKQENGARYEPTVSEALSIREQAEGHIFEVLMQFEEITGLKVEAITVDRRRPAGFGAKEIIEIKLITDF